MNGLNTTSALQISQVLRLGSLIVVSILMAKFGLSTDLIGFYESLLFWATSVSYFWLNGLLQGTLTFLPRFDVSQFKMAKVHISAVFVALSVAVFFSVLLLKQNFLSIENFNSKKEICFDLFFVFQMLLAPTLVLESFWTVENRPLSIVALSAFTNVGLPLVIAAPLWVGMDFEYSFYGMIFIGATRFIVLIINGISLNATTFQKTIFRDFLSLSWPIILYSLLNGLVTIFTNGLAQWYAAGDESQFAIFRFGAREFPLVLALTTGLSNAMVPALAKNGVDTEGLSLLKNKSTRLMHALFPMSIILVLTSKFLFPLVFNPDFEKSAAIFNVFALLIVSRVIFPQSVLLALGETKKMLRISNVETLSIVVLGCIFTHFFGLIGVAWATFAGFLLEKILIARHLQTQHNVQFGQYTNAPLFGFYTVLLLLAYAVSLIL